MSVTCHDVCEVVSGRLLALGFSIPSDEDGEIAILEALGQCTLVRGDVQKELLSAFCGLCRRLNPQHEHCESCEDMEEYRQGKWKP